MLSRAGCHCRQASASNPMHGGKSRGGCALLFYKHQPYVPLLRVWKTGRVLFHDHCATSLHNCFVLHVQ